MSRCSGGDDSACVRLLVAGQLAAGRAGIAPEDQRPNGDGRYDDPAATLARWALRQRCLQGDALSCLAFGEWPAACRQPSWSACHAAFAASGASALPFLHRVDYQDESAFAGFFPGGTPWVLLLGALKVGDLAPRPLLDRATAAQSTVLDVVVEADALRLLLRVRREDPRLAALGPQGDEIALATFRHGRWTVQTVPGPVQPSGAPTLTPGGVLFPVEVDGSFPYEYRLVRWSLGAAPQGVALATEGWSAAGDWLLTQAAADDAPIVRTNLATGASESWPAPHEAQGSVAADGSAWFALDGQVLRWDLGAVEPEPIAVEASQPYNGAETPRGEGRVARVRARSDGNVDVVWAGGEILDTFDRDGNFRHSGDLGSLSGPFGAWQAGPTFFAWAESPAPPAWAAALPPLSLDLPDAEGERRGLVVDRTGAPLYPAEVRMVRVDPDPDTFEPQPDSGWRATQPDGGIALRPDEWAPLAAGDVVAVSVRTGDGLRREFSIAVDPASDSGDDLVATMVDPQILVPAPEGVLVALSPRGESWLTVRADRPRVSGLDTSDAEALIFVGGDQAFRADTWETDAAGGVVAPTWTPLPGRRIAVVDQRRRFGLGQVGHAPEITRTRRGRADR